MGADIAFLRASDDEVGKTVWAETLLDEMNATEFSKAVSRISGGPQALALGFGHYTEFIRAKEKMEKGLGFLNQAARTKSEKEKEILLKKYWESIYEAFSATFDANRRASINWPDYMSERFGAEGIFAEQTGKLNAVTAIDYMEKKSKLPLSESYRVLSEFVHPNAGSKMLVVNTKRQHHPIMDALKIGENRQNAAAALFYFDHLSEGSYYSCTMALSLFQQEQNFIAMLDSLCSAGSPRTMH